MKSLNSIFAFLLLASFACDPLSDYRDDLEKGADWNTARQLFQSTRDAAPGEEYELTEEDYGLSSNEDVQRNKSFSADAPASQFMPEILTAKYYGENTQVMEVTYENYVAQGDWVLLSEEDYYTFSEQDYDRFGLNGYIGYGDELKYIVPVLRNLHPHFVDGDVYTVAFRSYRQTRDRFAVWEKTGKSNTFGPVWRMVEEVVYGDGPGLEDAYELSASDFESMGTEAGQPGQYKNFSDDMNVSSYLSPFLEEKYSNAEEGFQVKLQYAYYGAYGMLMDFTIDDSNWSSINVASSWNWETAEWSIATAATTESRVGNFIFTEDAVDYAKTEWITDPFDFSEVDGDNNKEYTLTGTDYTMVGEGYPNFDLRNNTREGILAKIGTILKAHHMTSMEIGDVFKVNFATYGSGSGYSISSPIYLEVVDAE